MKILFAIAALAVSGALFASAVPAWAGPVTRQIVVPYSDLNLSREAGARALIGRIEFAATRVCGGKPAMGDLQALAAFRACKEAAVNRALSDIHHPMVERLYGRQPRMARN